jgi:hypothetical protein
VSQLRFQTLVRQLQIGLPLRILAKAEPFVEQLDDIEAVM